MSLKIGERQTFETIEDIQKRARSIVSICKKKELTPIQNKNDLEFLSELFKTHPNAKEKGITGSEKYLNIYKGRSKQNKP